jgi:hypothetical protein
MLNDNKSRDINEGFIMIDKQAKPKESSKSINPEKNSL